MYLYIPIYIPIYIPKPIYIYIYIYIYINIYIYIYICIYLYVYIYLYLYQSVSIYLDMYLDIFMYINRVNLQTRACSFTTARQRSTKDRQPTHRRSAGALQANLKNVFHLGEFPRHGTQKLRVQITRKL